MSRSPADQPIETELLNRLVELNQLNLQDTPITLGEPQTVAESDTSGGGRNTRLSISYPTGYTGNPSAYYYRVDLAWLTRDIDVLSSNRLGLIPENPTHTLDFLTAINGSRYLELDAEHLLNEPVARLSNGVMAPYQRMRARPDSLRYAGEFTFMAAGLGEYYVLQYSPEGVHAYQSYNLQQFTTAPNPPDWDQLSFVTGETTGVYALGIVDQQLAMAHSQGLGQSFSNQTVVDPYHLRYLHSTPVYFRDAFYVIASGGSEWVPGQFQYLGLFRIFATADGWGVEFVLDLYTGDIDDSGGIDLTKLRYNVGVSDLLIAVAAIDAMHVSYDGINFESVEYLRFPQELFPDGPASTQDPWFSALEVVPRTLTVRRDVIFMLINPGRLAGVGE